MSSATAVRPPFLTGGGGELGRHARRGLRPPPLVEPVDVGEISELMSARRRSVAAGH